MNAIFANNLAFIFQWIQDLKNTKIYKHISIKDMKALAFTQTKKNIKHNEQVKARNTSVCPSCIHILYILYIQMWLCQFLTIHKMSKKSFKKISRQKKMSNKIHSPSTV